MSWHRRRAGRPQRGRACVGSYDRLEPRLVLDNGVITSAGIPVPAHFVPAPNFLHHLTFTSIDQDPNNDGLIVGTTVTLRGLITGPFASGLPGNHGTISFAVLEGGSPIG